ncbi:DeoR/GlpR family DNA-binding transcription regulator [Gleimia hominis]|uniref:DeoR/GlpR family DNA-binding transcription regulator n=1 Tax=Gleimia hominis TaxID=595468 RepID=UPI000C80C3A6|nr:DeoR/GlpR family DNA-binding transcription regulator [Gleimia hominis]WIK64507.1 DeoR/GlpR family DNA-binding transcription regulator [Gleimia hominis]
MKTGDHKHVEQRARRNQIASIVLSEGETSVEELSEKSGVSVMTVYRDVAVLENAGVLARDRGKVFATASGLHEASARYRLMQEEPQKKAMAQCAAQLIVPGSSLLIDDSTSAVWALRELLDGPALSVVTNSMLVAGEMAGKTKHSLMLLGGEYQAWAEATMGPVTCDTLLGIHADVCILSASGVKNLTLYHPYADVAAVKRQMMKAASRTIVMLDHTKFARRALHAFGSLTDVDTVVVDSLTPQETLDRLKEAGVHVLVAPC